MRLSTARRLGREGAGEPPRSPEPPLKASTRCQATGGPRSLQSACRALPAAQQPRDQRLGPSRATASRLEPPTLPPQHPGAFRVWPARRLEPPPGYGASARRRLFAQPSTPATDRLTPSKEPRSRRAPQSQGPATRPDPGADQHHRWPAQGSASQAQPPTALHQRPGAAPPRPSGCWRRPRAPPAAPEATQCTRSCAQGFR